MGAPSSLAAAAAMGRASAGQPGARESRLRSVANDSCGEPVSFWVAEMSFETKAEQHIGIADVQGSLAAGNFVWVDIDIHESEAARDVIAPLDLMEEGVLDDALDGKPGTLYARYPRHLHLVMTGCDLLEREFVLRRVDVLFGDRSLVTIHHGPVNFLEVVKRGYREDFLHHAQTPSFLLYELWDHLLERYVEVEDALETRVQALEAALIGDVDDGVFAEVAELSSDLLHFRKLLLPARTVLTDLSSRKSRFISEATQPFLANMVGTVERVLQDVLVAREILANTVNLYMSVVGHRTNEVMRRLTVVSVIFLPLTFLVGVYGMNFDHQPELHWEYGYLLFWGVTIGLAAGLLVFLSRKRFF